MDFQRILALIAFTFASFLLWTEWQKHNDPAVQVAQVQKAGQSVSNGQVAVNSSVPQVTQRAALMSSETQLQHGQRVKVVTDVFNVEIDTVGGDIRDLSFRKHFSVEDKSAPLVFFSDKNPNALYVAQSGLLGQDLPTHKSVFQLASGQPAVVDLSRSGQKQARVTLVWTSPKGVEVRKIFTFDKENYVINVGYEIQNHSQAALSNINAYYQLLRNDAPPAGDPRFVHTYTGTAFFTAESKFRKINFSDIEKGKLSDLPTPAKDGWVSMLQHYFLSAWLPKDGTMTREFYAKKIAEHVYSAGVILPIAAVSAQQKVTLDVPLYVGPQYQDKLNKLANGLEYTVDYGWLTIIATPIFWVLSFIQDLIGNWGIAIILLTVLIKAAFYPLSAKSYASMAQMKLLAPKLQRIKEQYGEDRQQMHQAMMKLYQTEKINPFGGCLPIVVQIPVFISLYWVLLASVEMRQAPFMLWVTDLSSPDPLYILPAVMALTMFLQTKLNPTPPDPTQAKVAMFMPLIFGVFFFFMPSGLVLYWLVNNVLSIAQQWQITKAMEAKQANKAT